MKTVIITLLLSVLGYSQSVTLSGASTLGSTAVSGVTPTNHTFIPAGVCVDGMNNCNITTTFVIGATGDTGTVFMGYCEDVSCSLTGGVVTVTGCGGTWTQTTSAASVQAAWTQRVFTAPNLTVNVGCTIDVAIATNNFYYSVFETIDANGANASTPVDSSVSNNATGTSTSPSVTSSGNVSSSGELGIAMITCTGVCTNTGSYATLDASGSGTVIILDKTNPTSGSATTAAVTNGTNSAWYASLIALKQ